MRTAEDEKGARQRTRGAPGKSREKPVKNMAEVNFQSPSLSLFPLPERDTRGKVKTVKNSHSKKGTRRWVSRSWVRAAGWESAGRREEERTRHLGSASLELGRGALGRRCGQGKERKRHSCQRVHRARGKREREREGERGQRWREKGKGQVP